jgi:hypothetical protein
VVVSTPGAFALAVYDDGNGPALHVGGRFTTAGGVAANNIAKWDGSTWSALGSGVNGQSVGNAVVHDDGGGAALYVGGQFTSAGGVAASNIAKWDGSSWSALGGGVSGSLPYSRVYALTVYDDGGGPALYAGGNFENVTGHGDHDLAKWGCVDRRAPVLSYPSSVVVLDRFIDGPGEVVTFTVTASDDIDPSPVVVCTPPSGSLFPPGTTQVVCTATDASVTARPIASR